MGVWVSTCSVGRGGLLNNNVRSTEYGVMIMSTNKILFAGIEWMMQVAPARKSICEVPIGACWV